MDVLLFAVVAGFLVSGLFVFAQTHDLGALVRNLRRNGDSGKKKKDSANDDNRLNYDRRKAHLFTLSEEELAIRLDEAIAQSVIYGREYVLKHHVDICAHNPWHEEARLVEEVFSVVAWSRARQEINDCYPTKKEGVTNESGEA